MRILVYGINYSPELTGIGKYTGEMCAWLAKQGHEVTVITALPYYPEWQVHPNYRGKMWHREVMEGVEVYRCPLYVPQEVTSLKRIIHEFTFLASTLPIWFLLLFRKKFDITFTINPPFHLGLLPLLFSKLNRSKVISHIQDLQVDAAKDLGMIKNENFLNIMFGMESFILKNSTVVSTISDGMQRKIEMKDINPAKIWQFPNWVDEQTIKPLSKAQSLRSEFGFTDADKVVLYSGNLGEKQGLEVIIDAAKTFQSQPDVHFFISGTGGGKERLVRLAQDAGLTNVQFHPLQPYEKLSALLAMADVHLVLQKKSASDLVLPSKLTGILASGGCAIVTALPGTTLYDVINKYNMGILAEPESSSALVAAIQTGLGEGAQLLRENARKYAVEHLGKEQILRKVEGRMEELVKGVRGSY
ncbi:colanic acid biosynthesis glycosyltransferase WcaI [Dyadobacter luteus]|uniref:Colanic acid biosynthesis glycosyltransferase WcaI n=1 Tax=Dyadobacter luteus TaxID=2259619 RepID=A0A3D8YII6_9BACT|nr:WcaI family glycosyltransferase [Dyadobacter luteus]REA64490.1 colanic acid biosynthesis glycosyltransferase WcaI [Dyadobacter luteus]